MLAVARKSVAQGEWFAKRKGRDRSSRHSTANPSGPAVRTIALACALLTTLYFLGHSFNFSSQGIDARQSLKIINNLAPTVWRGPPPRVTKVTAAFGENDLYEAAIRSHEEHDRLNGYELKVLRERIVNSYWSKPAYLLSLVVQELAKPESERTEWIMWTGPDVIILNPQIPLEIFLPPDDFQHVHFIGTHDTEGLNTGAFFLQVHEWSVRMLIEVLSLPKNDPAIDHATEKDQMAIEMVLTSPNWRSEVTYQPKTWFNAYQLGVDNFEGKRGDLLVHFHDLEGDKWSAMASTIAQVTGRNNTWSVPLERTTYRSEIREYWERIRKSNRLLDQAESRISSDGRIGECAKRLGFAVHFEADLDKIMNAAMDALKEALGTVEGER